MPTGIFKLNILGQRVEVKQEHIDAWCELCQFPFEVPKCSSNSSIQRCWDGSGAIAGEWHKQHECPFIHKGEQCRCNDFKSIEDAFIIAGLHSQYKKSN